MGTRLPARAVLQHPVRQSILLAVEREPGVSLTRLRAKLRLSAGGLTYHAGVLERHRLLASRREGRARIFYLPSAGPPAPAGERLGATAQRVLDAARREGEVPFSDLPSIVGVGKPTVSYHVSRLRARGLVELARRGDGRHVVRAVRTGFQRDYDHQPTKRGKVAS